jgi:micrococcal nuclease
MDWRSMKSRQDRRNWGIGSICNPLDLRWYRLLVPTSGLFLLTSCQASPPKHPTIEISRVISGQSIEWIDKSQQPPVLHQGRLMGIDAPDLAQDPWGKQAKQRLEELIGLPGKNTVSVEFEGLPDKYGRQFVYLWKEDRLLNEQLLKDGYALASMRNASTNTTSASGSNKYRDRLLRGSQYARLMGEGIWNPQQPMRMSPAEFRKEEG